jgi:hypothetical protein
MERPLLRSSALLLVVALALSVPRVLAESGPTASPDPQANTDGLTVIYHDQGIDPREASHHFCHTRDYPVVRCFDSQLEVDADLVWIEPQEPGDPGSPADAAESSRSSGEMSPDFSGAYTIAYWDINYGGTALTLYSDIPNLGTLGWNDSISSIKSVNCGVPRYWADAGYGGLYWQNGCDAWSPSLSGANDTFSSVANQAP